MSTITSFCSSRPEGRSGQSIRGAEQKLTLCPSHPLFARETLITRFWKCARELNHNVYSMQHLSSHHGAIKKKLSVKFELNESFCFHCKNLFALILMTPTIITKKNIGKKERMCWKLLEAAQRPTVCFSF